MLLLLLLLLLCVYFSLSGSIDYEVIQSASFALIAVDTSPSNLIPRRSSPVAVTIFVQNVNDNQPVFVGEPYSELFACLFVCLFVCLLVRIFIYIFSYNNRGEHS